MKTLRNSVFVSALALGLALLATPPASAALNTLGSTTLSAALDNQSRQLFLASLTGVNGAGQPVSNGAIGNPTGASWTILFVDEEAIRVITVPSSTAQPVTVERGWDGTIVTAHASGSLVYVSQPAYFTRVDQTGACNSATAFVLPLINSVDGNIFDCRSSGQWIQIANGTMNPTPKTRIMQYCTGVVGSAETEYLNFAACSGATSATIRQVMSSAGTIANLQVFSSANVVGGTGKDVLTVYKNGSSTVLTCTIAAAAATCGDSTDSVAVAAGDVLTFQFVTASSDTAANMTVSVEKY